MPLDLNQHLIVLFQNLQDLSYELLSLPSGQQRHIESH